MTKLFAALSVEGLEEAGDRLGGANDPLPTNVYAGTVKVAYAGASAGGAQNVSLVLDVGGREVRETVYITSKKGENFYVDKKDPTKKLPLPGYTTIDDLCLLATGEPLTEQATEEKVIKIYNFDQRKEVPTPVQVLGGLTDKPVLVGILREISDKEKKNDAGVYTKTGETRTQNVIDKFFHPETKRTVAEYRHEVTTAEFHDAWVQRNAGKDRDRSTKTSGVGASGTGRPAMFGAAAGGVAKPKSNLFSK